MPAESSPVFLRSLDATWRRAAAKIARELAAAGDGEEHGPERELLIARAALELQNEELRRAEAELRASEARFLDLFEHAPVAYLSVDAHIAVVAANHAARVLLGIGGDPEHAAGGRDLRSFVVDDDLSRFQRFWQGVLTSGDREVCELTLRSLDGDRIPARLHAERRHCVTGEVVGARVTITDVTEIHREREARFQVESWLARSEARLSSLFEAALDGIVLTDGTGRIESVNRSAARMLGWQRDELVGRSVDAVLPEARRPHGGGGVEDFLAAKAAEAAGGGRNLTAERKDGSLLPLRVEVTRLTVDGEVLFAAFLRDRTHDLRLEEQLRQAQKLEAIGTLASGVAHDFNNLLMGIGGCVQVALDSLSEPSVVRPLLEDVGAGVRNGAEIARQLLAFSRKRSVAPAVIELGGFISTQTRVLNRLLGEAVKVSFEAGAEELAVRIDPGELNQILLNLCVNARDAMPRGGRIVLKTGQQTIADDTGDLAAGQYAVVTVVDTGEGMPPQVRERALDPFYTTKPTGRGTGLGLSTVYGIAAGAGGTVHLESTLGRGTSVEIWLPLFAGPTSPKAEPPTDDVETKQSGVILIVEDDDRVRFTTRYFLTRRGYRVLDAASVAEAEECLRRFPERIDLLLTDMVLPDGRGTDVIATVTAQRPDMKVLIMSAHDSGAKLLRGHELPEILQKPFDEATLLAHVKGALC